MLAAVGPEMSGEGKAISPILSEADMATITPSSTNPDITDPKFKSQYRPKGKAVYFRNVTTDAYQGPNMANYLFHQVKMKSVFVLDDGGAFGVGIADSFERRAKELGVKVLGRDRLDPKEADYKTILTKIKGMNPDALYYGGVMQAAAKLAPQAFEIMPRVAKAGSDGVYDLSWPKQSGKDAIEGWYCSQASPELVTDPKVEAWLTKFKSSMKRDPTNYSITAYNAVYVIADAVERTVKAKKPLTRSNLRDAIQATKLNSHPGPHRLRRERRHHEPDRLDLPVAGRRVQVHRGGAPEVGGSDAPGGRVAPARSPLPMSLFDVLLQQVVNGLALGMMYALLALGFTMVYGIIELINFSHFSVFMTGTFIGIIVLRPGGNHRRVEVA